MGQNIGASKIPATTNCNKIIAWEDKCVPSGSELQIFPKKGRKLLPSNSDPSVQKQRTVFVLKPNTSTPAPPTHKEDEFFTVLRKSLQTFPEEKRKATKRKIMELLFNIATNKLDPSTTTFVTEGNSRTVHNSQRLNVLSDPFGPERLILP